MLSSASRNRAFALAIALPCLLTSTASGQKQVDKDLKVISAYTFTMPKYRQLMAAMVNMGKISLRDSKVAESMEDTENLSLDQTIAQYSAIPPVKKAITDAGLTPREFAVAQGAMLHAGMSYGMMKHYKLTPDSVSKATGVSMANLEFFRVNEAEIERMGKEMQAQMPKEARSDEVSEDGSDDEESDSTE